MLALKSNQKSLFEDVECAFRMNSGHGIYETLDADHGRIEPRKCSILPAAAYLMEENLQAWKNLGTIIRLEARREVQGKVTQETCYYISRMVQPTSVHLSGDIGVLKISYIGIWISHSKRMHAEPEQGILHRIFLY